MASLIPSTMSCAVMPACAAAVLASTSGAPRDVQATAVRTPAGPELWLVNLTDAPQCVQLAGNAQRPRRAQVIDEANFVALGRDAPPRPGRNSRFGPME